MSVCAVLIFPEADTVEVERFRAQWDPMAASVAAHVTVVFPFESSTDALEATLLDVASHHRPFPLTLNEVTIWQEEYLFLLVGEGRDQVSALHHDLYAALPIAPDASIPFVPHMTVGRRPGQPTELAGARLEARAVPLSVTGIATALSVVCIEPSGRCIREIDVGLADRS
jgi:2'-5' RNA ligase